MTATQPTINLPLATHFNAISDRNYGEENRRSVVGYYFVFFFVIEIREHIEKEAKELLWLFCLIYKTSLCFETMCFSLNGTHTL